MPHWDAQGREEWVCQKSGHICTGKSTWVERDSELSKQLGCHGNVCWECMMKIPASVRMQCTNARPQISNRPSRLSPAAAARADRCNVNEADTPL